MSAVVEVQWMMTRLLAFQWVTALLCADGSMCSDRTDSKEVSNCCREIDTVIFDLKILGKP